jgi:hypothetical protein
VALYRQQHHSLLFFTIMNARAQKRSAADNNSNPLLQADILQRVLDHVGPGHWYFVSSVSSLWRDVYERVKSQTTAFHRHNVASGVRVTLFSSAFASPSRLKLVHSSCHYFLFMDKEKLEYLVGRYANKATLQTAHELTSMKYSSDTLTGAVRSGDLGKVIWLHTEQHCKLGDHIKLFEEAAMGGSTAVLGWLKHHGLDINADCDAGIEAASLGHWHVLQYLYKEGCDIPVLRHDVYYYAAKQGNLEMLKWLCDIGCDPDFVWNDDQYDIVASCHNVEVMALLIEKSALQLSTEVMSAAVESGNRVMCEFVHALGCPMDEHCCNTAADFCITEHDNLDLLRWFREHGCPWDTDWLAEVAAFYNSVALIEYMQQEGVVFTTKQMTEMLNIAGARDSLTTAKWLRQHGAEWPTVLKDNGKIWSGETLSWARTENCTSPLER